MHREILGSSAEKELDELTKELDKMERDSKRLDKKIGKLSKESKDPDAGIFDDPDADVIVNKELRTITFNGDITPDSSNDLITAIADLNQHIEIFKVKNGLSADLELEITLKIFSGGGSAVTIGDLYLAVKNSKNPITTVATGIVASAAVPLFLGGRKRKVSKYSYFLIHQIRGGITGTMEDIKDRMYNWDFIQENYSKIILQETKMKSEALEIELKNEKILRPNVLKELGFVDEIID